MSLTIPIATAGANSIEGIGTMMMMRGLGGIKAGNVATSTQMAGSVYSRVVTGLLCSSVVRTKMVFGSKGGLLGFGLYCCLKL